MAERYKRNPNAKCLNCGKAVYRRPNEIKNGRIFCSLTCYGLANRKEVPCIVCGKPLLAQLNKKTCSRACANINRAGTKYKLGRPRDKALLIRSIKIKLLEERGSKCERCGYNKPEVLQIHHRDRNRNNNEATNLEIICPNCHYEEHYLENSWLKNKVENI